MENGYEIDRSMIIIPYEERKNGVYENMKQLLSQEKKPDAVFCFNDKVAVNVCRAREFDSWISEKSTCRSHKTCFFCVKFLVFIYCILLQCVVKYNKGGILHASYYIEI